MKLTTKELYDNKKMNISGQTKIIINKLVINKQEKKLWNEKVKRPTQIWRIKKRIEIPKLPDFHNTIYIDTPIPTENHVPHQHIGFLYQLPSKLFFCNKSLSGGLIQIENSNYKTIVNLKIQKPNGWFREFSLHTFLKSLSKDLSNYSNHESNCSTSQKMRILFSLMRVI